MKVELDIKTFGDYFRFVMQKRGKFSREVAAELGINPSTIWRISSGYPFRLKWLIPIAKWCNLTPKQLWGLLEDEK